MGIHVQMNGKYERVRGEKEGTVLLAREQGERKMFLENNVALSLLMVSLSDERSGLHTQYGKQGRAGTKLLCLHLIQGLLIELF